VNLIGYVNRIFSWLNGLNDQYIIDGAVNGLAYLNGKFGRIMRTLQTGRIQTYLYVLLKWWPDTYSYPIYHFKMMELFYDRINSPELDNISSLNGIPLILITPEDKKQLVRGIGTIFSGLPLLLGIYLVFNFNPGNTGVQFQHHFVWIRSFNIEYFVGVDGLSFFWFF